MILIQSESISQPTSGDRGEYNVSVSDSATSNETTCSAKVYK